MGPGRKARPILIAAIFKVLQRSHFENGCIFRHFLPLRIKIGRYTL